MPTVLFVLIVATGFDSGGFFADSQSLAGAALLCLLAAYAGLARDPGIRITRVLSVAGSALALLAAWALLSSLWSEAAARALLDFNRILLYLAVLMAFGLLAERDGGLRPLLGAVGAGLFVVCAAGLLSRTLPELLPVEAAPWATSGWAIRSPIRTHSASWRR